MLCFIHLIKLVNRETDLVGFCLKLGLTVNYFSSYKVVIVFNRYIKTISGDHLASEVD